MALNRAYFKNERAYLLAIIAINFLLKSIPGFFLELGNDEVYYWTYAMYPDWSHFDHPPMVGWVIQFFTLNNSLKGELFFRLGSLVLSSINIWLLFNLVKRLYGSVAGFISVSLFIASGYFNVIAGLMVHPDTPQVFFIILTYKFLFEAFSDEVTKKKQDTSFLLASAFTGLAFLSKYHSLYIWLGIGFLILFNARYWFKRWALYVGFLITLLCALPVFIWNYQNHFVSFTFHSARVGVPSNTFNWISFIQFNAGQIVYQNPIVFVIIALSLVGLLINWSKYVGKTELLLLYLSLPVIIVFSFVSLFKQSLPHWSGPGFLGLIILTSKWLAAVYNSHRLKIRYTLLAANLLLFIGVYVAMFQINTGYFKTSSKQEEEDISLVGKGDFSLDMYGWRLAKVGIERILSEKNIDFRNIVFVTNKWFPAAHIDYYIANPLGSRLIALGRLTDIHKYYWININRKFSESNQLIYITNSQYFQSPSYLADYFDVIEPIDTLCITRNGEPAKYFFLFKLDNYKGNLPQFNLPEVADSPE